VDESGNGYTYTLVAEACTAEGQNSEKTREKNGVCVCKIERVRVRLLGVGDQSSRIENHEFKHIISVSIHDVIN